MMLDEFPQHLRQELQYLRDQEEADRKQREIDISTCKVHVMSGDLKITERHNYEIYVKIYCNEKWRYQHGI